MSTGARCRPLHMPVYTVQDHPESILEKADMRSHPELISAEVLDQHVPRMGNDVATNGWFVESHGSRSRRSRDDLPTAT